MNYIIYDVKVCKCDSVQDHIFQVLLSKFNVRLLEDEEALKKLIDETKLLVDACNKSLRGAKLNFFEGCNHFRVSTDNEFIASVDYVPVFLNLDAAEIDDTFNKFLKTNHPSVYDVFMNQKGGEQ